MSIERNIVPCFNLRFRYASVGASVSPIGPCLSHLAVPAARRTPNVADGAGMGATAADNIGKQGSNIDFRIRDSDDPLSALTRDNAQHVRLSG